MGKRTPHQIAAARARLPTVTRELGGHVTAGGKGIVPCPCHDDVEPSVSFNPGDDHEFVWYDQAEARCDPFKIRERWIDKGVAPELLGSYCATAPRPRKPAPAIDYRAECDRLRTALAAERAKVAAVLAVLADDSVTKPTMMRLRILAAAEGSEIPCSYREFMVFGKRARAGPTQLKDLAKVYVSTGPGQGVGGQSKATTQ